MLVNAANLNALRAGYLGAPMLMSAVVTRIGAGSFRLDFYRGTTRIGGAASLTYGFNAPVTGAPVPVISARQLDGIGREQCFAIHTGAYAPAGRSALDVLTVV